MLEKDDGFWLNLAYVCLAGISIYVLWLTIDLIGVQSNWIVRYPDWFIPLRNVGPVLIAVGSIWFVQADTDRRQYHLDSISELRKVVWPTAIDTRRMTLIVCWFVGIFGVILFFFDSLWAYLLKLVLA